MHYISGYDSRTTTDILTMNALKESILDKVVLMSGARAFDNIFEAMIATSCRDATPNPGHNGNRVLVWRFEGALPEQSRVATSRSSQHFSRQYVASGETRLWGIPPKVPPFWRDSDGRRWVDRESSHLSCQNGRKPLAGHFAGHLVRPGRSRFESRMGHVVRVKHIPK